MLHSDIARLVLGYFVNNNLWRVALTLCRTSPHLHQEFIALRQGLQPHNFLNGGLEDIIREHVKITSLVANALKKLPIDTRQRLQQLKLSERVHELLKLEQLTKTTTECSKDSAAGIQNTNSNMQRKRRRVRVHTLSLDGKQAKSASPSPSERVSCKRRRLLDPHLYCSIGPNDHVEEENESLDSSTGSDITSEHTDDTINFSHGHGHGPKNNSTPRTATSEEAEVMMPTPQTMPEITHAIMTNREFQNKLLNNINMALQSLTVHAPTAESVNSEAVLDGLVRNILEATEKDPSFDRVIQEVVGMNTTSNEPIPATVGAAMATAATEVEPAPPQTPLIIRTAVASANAAAASVNANGDINMVNGGNAIIQLNGNSSIGTLIDPNFSISKLIVLNSNESALKQQQQSTANLSFGSENLINLTDNGSTLADADAVANVAAVGGGQVCVDATNGQLTFPMFLSNEGLLSHLPFLVNNEWLAQQLRSDAFTNMDVSHIEIPLPEPITVAANQLPPNSIIINSAAKQLQATVEGPSVEPPTQLIADLAKTMTGNTTLLERSASKVSNTSAVPASLDSSRLVQERMTPSTSGIVNDKAFRSLSTPRKRTSHVRTLNFSPKGITNMHGAPLSMRRLQQKQQTQRRTVLKTLKEKIADELDENVVQPEKIVIIKNVEILPSFSRTPSATLTTTASEADAVASANAATSETTPADMSGNESNGCVPPLFAMEECSNQTVIKAVTAAKHLKQATKSSVPMVATPKRMQKRRAAANACKRIISQVTVQDDPSEQHHGEKGASSSLDDSKENQKLPTTQQPKVTEQKTELNEEKEDLLAAWQRQMNSTSMDLELRLREINAKRQEVFLNKTRVRRIRPVAANKKKALSLSSPFAPLTAKKRSQKQKKQQQQLSSNNVEGELIVKITTPQKSPLKPKVGSQDVKEANEIKKPKESKKMKDNKPFNEIIKSDQEHKHEPVKQVQHTTQQAEAGKMDIKDKPVDRNMANMAALLETPFKVTLTEADSDVPPTPGPTLMDTPYAKLVPSTSFLFGSDTKSILDTPMLTAVTPGMRLTTPFGHALGTPHSSAAKTDYSGGSSYYRPDEAEHTDTNAQCALPSTSPRDLVEQIPKQTTTCFELYAERLPVEPMMLRRVRSFGSEAVDSVEGAAALTGNGESSSLLVETPHYKLVAGLPDTIIDHSSSSSSGSSSTSSSSSSSSSSGSSSNSSTNNTSASSPKSGHLTTAVMPAQRIKLLELDNLSDISSTEDEEWLKVAAACGSLDAPPLTIDSEPAQLVSQDGEVRYPLRSWLTPSKEAATTSVAAADADTSGEMAPPALVPIKLVQNVKAVEIVSSRVESIEQRIVDLAEVRERVKAKFKQETTPKGRPKKVNQKLTAMRETAKQANPNINHANKSPKKECGSAKTEKKTKVTSAITSVKNQGAPPSKPVKPKQASCEAIRTNLEKPEPSSSNLDPALLSALNLSAKKQHQQHNKLGRAAVHIAAQPAPSLTTRQRRGRPKKPPNIEPSRGCMRRSSRLIDNKTPALEEPQSSGSEVAKPVKLSSNNKITKKPAKKRAEARIETAAMALAMLAEAHTTHQSPEQLQPRKHPPISSTGPVTSGDYDLDMCLSTSHVINTFSFAYADSGSKAVHRVLRQPPAFFKNFQMRIMVDSELHNVRITSPLLLHQSLGASAEDNANPTGIRNIPKKRIIRFTSGGSSHALAATQDMPMASSTPLARNTQNEEHDENDIEVASINTLLTANSSEEQQMEGHDAGVQIEDIESILSHLHGT